MCAHYVGVKGFARSCVHECAELSISIVRKKIDTPKLAKSVLGLRFGRF